MNDSSIQSKIERYRSLKNFILRAFKAESISRNYPEYSESEFETLTVLPETERVVSQVEENNRVYDEYFEIEFSVEQEIERLKNRRFKK